MIGMFLVPLFSQKMKHCPVINEYKGHWVKFKNAEPDSGCEI